MSSGTMIARVPFRYCGSELERGELVELKESNRNNQLISLGYFIAFDKFEFGRHMCDGCGKVFANEAFYTMHKKKGCLKPSPPITRQETAELMNIDAQKLVVED